MAFNQDFFNNLQTGMTADAFAGTQGWGMPNFLSGSANVPALPAPAIPQSFAAPKFDLGGFNGTGDTGGLAAAQANVPGGGNWFTNLFKGQQGENGTFGPSAALQGVQALTGLANVWQGMEGLDLAKDTFNFQKDAFNKNFANQVQTTNTQLEDRELRRTGARGLSGDAQYSSVQQYLDKNAVKA